MFTLPLHPARTAALCLLVGLVIGFQGCGPQEATPPPPVVTPPTPPTAPSAVKAVPAHGASVVPAAPPAITGPAAPSPAPETKPAVAAAAPLQAVNPVSDPGGEVAVKPTKAGLSRIGTASCKMCHKIQFVSWSDTAHGKRTPPLDCESCHGPGSEYKGIAIMKDPAKARAAGLVLPGPSFCATCHKRNWSDGMLKKAHAHKT